MIVIHNSICVCFDEKNVWGVGNFGIGATNNTDGLHRMGHEKEKKKKKENESYRTRAFPSVNIKEREKEREVHRSKLSYRNHLLRY